MSVTNDTHRTSSNNGPRPGIIYLGVFSWMSITCARFIAPFLKTEALLSDSVIGFTIAITIGITSVVGTIGGSFADYLETKCYQTYRIRNLGRAIVLCTSIFLCTVFFLLHSLYRIFPTILWFQSTKYHIALRMMYAIFCGPILPVLDGLTLAHLQNQSGKEKADYGKERLFGAISWGITSVVMGPFLDLYGYLAMYAFAVLSLILTFIGVIIYTKGGQQQTNNNLTNNSSSNTAEEGQKDENKNHLPFYSLLKILLCSSIVSTAFFFSYFCNSAGLNVVENLVFLFFNVLGSSNTLNGATVLLTVLFEVPIFQIAPALLRRFGASTLLQISNIAFIIRVIGYTLVPEGKVYLVLFLEPLHGVIYGCSQTGAVEFVSKLMPQGYESSGQGLIFLFRGTGGIIGNSLGGYLSDAYNAKIMYRFFAVVVAVGTMVLSICEYSFDTDTASNNNTTTTTNAQIRGDVPSEEQSMLLLHKEEEEKNKSRLQKNSKRDDIESLLENTHVKEYGSLSS